MAIKLTTAFDQFIVNRHVGCDYWLNALVLFSALYRPLCQELKGEPVESPEREPLVIALEKISMQPRIWIFSSYQTGLCMLVLSIGPLSCYGPHIVFIPHR